jgi:hypothetical protein
MTTPTTSITPIREDADATQQVLCRLRERYRQHHDLFTRQELARLSFVRWLHRTGRVQP